VLVIHTAAKRQSFIAVMRDIPEPWELSYDPHAAPVYDGLVHDYKMAEGIAVPGPFAPRRTLLDQALTHFIFDPEFTHAIGANQSGLVQVINLDIRRKVHDFHFPYAIEPDAGAVWRCDERTLLALPDRSEHGLNIIDTKNWKIIRRVQVETDYPQLHEQPNSPSIWISDRQHHMSRRQGPARQILDKKTLAVKPQSSALRTDGEAPLIWLEDGHMVIFQSKDHEEIRVYNTTTLELIKRLSVN
jgi:hypothetical protein